MPPVSSTTRCWRERRLACSSADRSRPPAQTTRTDARARAMWSSCSSSQTTRRLLLGVFFHSDSCERVVGYRALPAAKKERRPNNWPALASEEEDRCKMPPAAPLRRGGVILRRLLRRAGRGAERRGAPEGTRTSSLHPTYLRSAKSKMLLRKRGASGRASKQGKSVAGRPRQAR